MKPIRSLENERCVLGAMLRDQHELYRVSYLLTGEMFATDAHQKTYAAILEAGKADLSKVAQVLWQRQQVKDLGGYGYLAVLLDACPAPCQAPWYAKQIKEMWMRRKLMHEANELLNAAKSPYGPASEMARDSVQRLQRLAS
jgi:replicative DNA helicase